MADLLVAKSLHLAELNNSINSISDHSTQPIAQFFHCFIHMFKAQSAV